jgi:hypothetical protein
MGVGAPINILKLEIYKSLNKQCNAKSPMSIELCTIKLFIIKNKQNGNENKKKCHGFQNQRQLGNTSKSIKKEIS